MISLRESLTKIGIATTTPFAFRTSLVIHPPGLQALARACRDPLLGAWQNPARSSAENFDWTEEAQGMATDGPFWYVASNTDDGREGLYKFSAFNSYTKISCPLGDDPHIGAPCVRNGFVFVPTQHPHGIWRVSVDFTSSAWFPAVDQPQDNMFPWCDIHPTNGLIYTSNFEMPTTLWAYRIEGSQLVRAAPDIPIQQPADGQPTHEVQGACFTANHRWLAVCDVDGQQRIHCHSALNGAFQGRRTLLADTDESPWTTNELESITVSPRLTNDGVPVQVHVLELNNEAGTDDIYLWHFSVPEPDAL